MGGPEYSIAVLYVCTGKYTVFWPEFFESSERYFLQRHQKTYFVFTDAETVPYLETGRVRMVSQSNLGWPGNTLYRFRMFDSIASQLKAFDFVYFLNANMLFVQPVNEECLPLDSRDGLLGVRHPGFLNKTPSEFTYERDPRSLAAIPLGQGKYYFMGGFNGGRSSAYLSLIATLKANVEQDERNGVIAVWHDESHLNAYLLHRDVTVLGSEYGYPEGSGIPLEPKVIIRDKTRYGGHNTLRGNPPTIGFLWPTSYWARRTAHAWYGLFQSVPDSWVVGVCPDGTENGGGPPHLKILSGEERRRLARSSTTIVPTNDPNFWVPFENLMVEPDPRALILPPFRLSDATPSEVGSPAPLQDRPLVIIFADEQSDLAFYRASGRRWRREIPDARFLVVVESPEYGATVVAAIAVPETEVLLLAGDETDAGKLPSSRHITLGRMHYGWWAVGSRWIEPAIIHVDSPLPIAHFPGKVVVISPSVSLVVRLREMARRIKRRILGRK